MKLTKIQVAFAEDNEQHRIKILAAINETSNYEVSINAVSGRDLISQLKSAKKLPKLILMDMQMPCCDGLLATIICKRLFPTIKIVGLSSHTDGIVVSELLTEGGHSFLSKMILTSKSHIKHFYKVENAFENALNQIITTNDVYLDVMLDETGEEYKNRVSTKQIIENLYKHLKDTEILYLQLNAAGFNRAEIAEIMNKSEATIKYYTARLREIFKAENHTDLINISINLGIVKLVKIFQPPAIQIF